MEMAVIGAGAMGKWFANFAKNSGWNVKITDIDQEKAQKVAQELGVGLAETNVRATEGADIVLISVPIKETPKIISEVSESLENDALLIDIASVKEDPVDTMTQTKTEAEMVSMHPLFGPGAEDLKNRTIVAVPIRDGEKYQSLRKLLSNLGAQIVEMEASEHDRIMSVTQSLTHFTLLSYLSALKSMNASEKAKELRTPMFQKLLDISKAFLIEDPELCGDIQTENKYSPMARGSLMEACRSLNVALQTENVKEIEKIFEEATVDITQEEIEEAYQKLYERSEGEER